MAGFEYADFVISDLGDNKISLDELNKIAELGANTAAGFRQNGVPTMSHLANMICANNGITASLARGQNHYAKANLGNLEKSLGTRPSPDVSRPDSPGFGGGNQGPGVSNPGRDKPDVNRPSHP